MNKLTLTLTAAATLLGSTLAVQAQNTGVALGTATAGGAQVLVPFSTVNFTTPSGAPAVITGAGTTIVDIDFYPVNGLLYGLGANGALFTFTQTAGAFTGAAVQVVAPNGTIASTSGNIDFNPSADRLRIYTGTGPTATFRLTPDVFDNTGLTAGALTTDGTLATGNNLIGGNAYTNNFNGTAATALYSLDITAGNLLLNSGAPQFLGVTTVGALGLAFTGLGTDNVGFDIAQDGTAYASAGNSLYTVNLTTGLATLVGTQTNPAVNFTTFAITAVPEPGTYVLSAFGGIALLLWARRRGGPARA